MNRIVLIPSDTAESIALLRRRQHRILPMVLVGIAAKDKKKRMKQSKFSKQVDYEAINNVRRVCVV